MRFRPVDLAIVLVLLVSVIVCARPRAQTTNYQCIAEKQILDERRQRLVAQTRLLEQRYVGVTDQRVVRDLDSEGDRLLSIARDWLRDLESFKARCRVM